MFNSNFARTLLSSLPIFTILIQGSSQKNSVFEDILTQSVLIETDFGSGSGFLYKCGEYLYLITARHVIVSDYLSASSTIKATLYPHGTVCGNPIQFSVDLEKAHSESEIRFATSHDFIFIELGKMKGPIPIFDDYVKALSKPFYLPKFFPQGAFTNLDSLVIGEEAFLFGYPSSLATFDQFDFKRPIMRSGTIASRSCVNKGNRPIDYRVLIDARVDQGMSGGFVLIKTEIGKYSLIGIMIELVPLLKEVVQNEGSEVKIITENSGLSVVLSFDTIVSAIDKFQKERASRE